MIIGGKMKVLVEPKDQILRLVNDMNEVQLLQAANYIQFIRQKSDNDALDLVKASESTLDFWNNEEDKVWDNV
jgi:hypothetical protein